MSKSIHTASILEIGRHTRKSRNMGAFHSAANRLTRNPRRQTTLKDRMTDLCDVLGDLPNKVQKSYNVIPKYK